jgi:hypothetical protein
VEIQRLVFMGRVLKGSGFVGGLAR